MVERVHELTAVKTGWQETTQMVGKFNRMLRGWANYRQVGTVSGTYRAVDRRSSRHWSAVIFALPASCLRPDRSSACAWPLGQALPRAANGRSRRSARRSRHQTGRRSDRRYRGHGLPKGQSKVSWQGCDGVSLPTRQSCVDWPLGTSEASSASQKV
ncbi:MAG: hypothetical protein KBF63_19050 [Rhodoferax sp.]|nr:hypothetical protein [Rhodoferax sp.]MBP9931382.1 hypothetical protein [Rhodoferax sp.]